MRQYLITLTEEQDYTEGGTRVYGRCYPLSTKTKVKLGQNMKVTSHDHYLSRHVPMYGMEKIRQHQRERSVQVMMRKADEVQNAGCAAYTIVPDQDAFEMKRHSTQKRSLAAWVERWGL